MALQQPLYINENNCLVLNAGRYKACVSLQGLGGGGVSGDYLPLSGGTLTGAVSSNNTFTGTGFIKTGGTASQFLKADGSIDSSTYFLSAGGDINGIGGNGYFGAIAQSATPSTPTSGFRLFANSSNALSWKGQNGFIRTFDGTSNTADRAYVLPDASGTIALISNLSSYLPLAGTSALAGNIVPSTDNTRSIGSTANRVLLQASTLGFGTTPTHTITVPSVGTGYTHYNTADQTTNWERARMYWTSNTYTIAMEASGTGSARNIAFVTNGTARTFTINQAPVITGIFNFNSTSSSAQSIIGTTSINTNSAGTTGGISILDTYNQSGTAGYKSLWISPYEQSVGSGTKLLVDVGTNTLGGGAGTHTSLLAFTNTGLTGFATSAPTHTITLSSTTTGYTHYNTSDQVTNYERVRKFWSSNLYNIQSEAGGSGTARNIFINVASDGLVLTGSVNLAGKARFSMGALSGNGSLVGVIGTLSSSSATQNGFVIAPTINHSGTANYNSLLISTYVIAGVNNQFLINAGTNSAGDNTGTHTRLFSVANTGDTYISGNTLIGSTVNTGEKLQVTGDIKGTGVIKTLRRETIREVTGTAMTDYWFGGNQYTTEFTQHNPGLGYTSISAGMGNTIYGLSYNYVRSRSTNGTTSVALLNNDGIIYNQYLADNGTQLSEVANYQIIVDGTPNADMPGRFQWATRTSGSADVLTRMMLKSSGNLILQDGGTFTDEPTAKVQINGGTTKGFLGPRMTTAQFEAIASKPAGLQAYSTDNGTMIYSNGTYSETVGSKQPVSSIKTGAYTVTGSDYLIKADTTSSAFSITLPTGAIFTGKIFVIKRINAGGNALTIVGTIDGVVNPTLTSQYSSMMVMFNGTNYDLIS